MSRPPLPPSSEESAIKKVRAAEDAWNTRPRLASRLPILSTAASAPLNQASLRLRRLIPLELWRAQPEAQNLGVDKTS